MALRALLLTSLLIACGDPDPLDAGTDSGPEGMDLVLVAQADPGERTDCTDPPEVGVARAKHVTCARELIDGALAMGRIGDIVLENARARFLVRTGEGAAAVIGAPAGGVIDASLGGGPDLLKELFPIFDLVSMGPTVIEVIDAGGDDEARVRVLFDDAPIALVETVLPGVGRAVRLRGQLDYVLRADEDFLRIEIGLTTEEGLSRSGATVGVLGLLGGQELFEPGVGVLSSDVLGGPGNVVIGERPEGAIGLSVAVPDASVTHIATIHLIRGARATLTRGALSLFEARLALGETASDVAMILMEGDPVTIAGAPDDRVLVASADGTPLLRTRFGADGEALIPLPPGEHVMTAGFRGYFEGPAVPVGSALAPPASGAIDVVATVEGAVGAPVRVTVESGGAELERFTAMGETKRRFPPGDYRVTISHGLEYDVSVVDVTITDGSEERLEPDLLRVIDTDGWVSVDLHLHSDLSTDSVHPIEDAVRLLAAEGVQAAAATDHDYVTDYARIGARAGVDLALVSGVEVSTTTFGHINGYPLTPHPERPGAGAPPWFDMEPTDIFVALRGIGDPARGGALVQINHPRLGDASFFGARRLDRDTGTLLDSLDLGFDVVEVWNGYTRGGNEESFEDYLALIAAGHLFTMVGNSDSHIPERPPGSPRSFVRVADEATWTWRDLRRALAAGDVTVAAAAFVTAELAGPATGDSVPVQIRVQAPPWARLDRLRVYAGRTATVDRALTETSDPVRFDEVVDVPLGGAEFIVVRVDGPSAPAPMQHFEPMGVTNPLRVR